MFEAQLLMGQGSEGTQVFSPWFPRQGDNARMTLEVVAISGATIKVEVFTKSSETDGDGSLAGTSGTDKIERTTAGRETYEWSGNLNELVRYKFTVTDATTKWVLFRMLPPVWFDTIAA